MKKVFTRGSVSLALLAVFYICVPALAQTQPPAIPSTFFGIHVNNPTLNGQSSYPVQVTYGQFRNWDVYQVSWPDIEVCEATSPDPTGQCFQVNGTSTFGRVARPVAFFAKAGAVQEGVCPYRFTCRRDVVVY